MSMTMLKCYAVQKHLTKLQTELITQLQSTKSGLINLVL